MDRAIVIVIILQVFFQPSLSDLFIVEAAQTAYVSEYGGNVVMGCKFNAKPSDPQDGLKVTWHWKTSSQYLEVIQVTNTVEQSTSPRYQDRAKMLLNELKHGWAKLQLSDLKINDSGTYECLVQTDKGTDYKTITLSVKAPFKSISKHVERSANGDKVLLTCESEGYPESPVVWMDGHLWKRADDTSTTTTPDHLIKITSRIQVSSSEENNYTCNFTRDGHSATFHIPDDIPTPPGTSDAVIVVFSLCLILTVVVVVAVIIYRQQKGSRASGTRKFLVEDGEISAAACLQSDKGNKYQEITLTEGSTEESLGSYLKAYYSEFTLSSETRRHCDSFAVEELPHRLQNNEGQLVKLQDLLPEAGEIRLLEGPPGSGKTTVAHILVSSWTTDPKQTVSNLIDLSCVDLLVHVDCSAVKRDLLEEITTQLSLGEKTSAEELRTVLSTSSKTLLFLDGHKEGNQIFDETLGKFLSERGSCRVVVTSCLGDCPTLRGTLGERAVLKLQMQSAKY